MLLSQRLRMVLLAGIGIVAAFGPMLASGAIIQKLALDEGRVRLQVMANAMTAHAEGVLDEAAAALASLHRGGVAGCNAADLAFISEAVLARATLKEIGVYDAAGRLACSNFGPTDVEIGTDGAVGMRGGELALSVVAARVPRRAALAIRRDFDSGGGLAAIIETSALLADAARGAAPRVVAAHLVLAGGGEVVRTARGRPEGGFVEARRASARHPIVASVAAPKAVLLEPFGRIAGYARIAGGLLGAGLLVFLAFQVRRRPTLAAAIDAGLAGDEFVPYYQPIVDATDGRVSGCEVLVRWARPGEGLVRPDLFVPLAEATGQIIPITRRLMERVERDLGELASGSRRFRVAINLVAEHLASEEIVADVRRIFSGNGIRPENLVFEITERRPLGDFATACEVVAQLQALGAEIALDDAGTGHGGLATIQTLGLDAIKIDRMFVDAIGQDANRAPIVDALIDLGRELGMRIVAEGVETEGQFAYLRARGVRSFQGFLFARPMPAESLRCFVRAFTPAPAKTAVALAAA